MTVEPDEYDGRATLPYSVNLETTRFCNLRCRMCEFVHLGTVASGPHMDPELLDRFSAEILPLVERVQPTVSGEPLMTRNLPALLERAAHYGVRLDIVTNGMLLNQRMLDLILPVLGQLNVSFDAPTKATLESIRTGARFERIVTNLRRACARVRELPADRRPVVALVATLMRRNIEELPALVDFAADLGIDRISCHHVHPFNEETRRDSLVHHRELAIACIDHAIGRAEARAIALHVDALGLIGAETAADQGGTRHAVSEHGVVEGLGERSVNQHRCPEPTGLDRADPRNAAIVARRDAARRDLDCPPPSDRVAPPAAGYPESIWTCGYLWSRSMVNLNGDIVPCCIPGVPVLGNLQQDRFADIWNGAAYRQMRARMAAKDPEPSCRGCQWIREVRDPAAIARHLHGLRAPTPATVSRHRLVPLGVEQADLAPGVRDHVAPPTVTWEPVADSGRYEVELSLDDFVTLAFCTSWHHAPLTEPRYRIPEWVWAMAPIDLPVSWRAVAYWDGSRILAGAGRFRRRAVDAGTALEHGAG